MRKYLSETAYFTDLHFYAEFKVEKSFSQFVEQNPKNWYKRVLIFS